MTPAIGIFWAAAIGVALLAILAVLALGVLKRLVLEKWLRQHERAMGLGAPRPIWNRNDSDGDRRTGTVGFFYVQVYRLLGRRWGWHVWGAAASVYSWQRRGSRWFRVLAVRDALREIGRLRTGERT